MSDITYTIKEHSLLKDSYEVAAGRQGTPVYLVLFAGEEAQRFAQEYVNLMEHPNQVALLTAEGMGWQDRAWAAERRVAALEAERDRPETEDFFKGVPLEAAHQRGRWPAENDAGKTPADWFWLVGYLAGKCLTAHLAGNSEKALHHTISTAAALANWHLAIKGGTEMRPGIETPTEAAELLNEKGTSNG